MVNFFLSFFKITNERIPHERGALLRQIDPIGIRPALIVVVVVVVVVVVLTSRLY